ncbi:hypothetical protein CDAR_607561 [Caerostris darwini]|uniref:Uncharacterized protein n=1 Tax=Caerostris darwini TaxID=1538125 RepID=A0AAV4RKR7_9ARAC|nr:hypothetical protein CDAR_607561 [Caerostris darwini]
MAEWSKALRSGRSPLLVGVGSNPTSGKLFCIRTTSGWPSGLRRCVQVAVHFLWAWVRIPLLANYFAVNEFSDNVRMAEWSKALRSGRSPLLVGVGSNPTSGKLFCIRTTSGWPSGLRRCVQVAVHFLWAWVRIPLLANYFAVNEFSDNVRMAEWSKALRSGRSPLLVGVGSNPTSGKLFCIRTTSGWPSGLRRCVQVAVHFLWAWVRIPLLANYFAVNEFSDNVRMAEWSKALRSGRSPLLVGVGSNPTSGKLFCIRTTSGWPSGLRRCVQVAVHFLWAWVRIPLLANYFAVNEFSDNVRMAEWSKALRSGRSPLLVGVGSNPTSGKLFCIRTTSGWPSGLRRCVQVAVHFLWAWVRIPLLANYFAVNEFSDNVRMAEWSKALRSGRSPLLVGVGSNPTSGKLFCIRTTSGWPSGLRRCVQVAVHFLWASDNVRMAEWSKALRSGRSPLLVGVGSNPTSGNLFCSK